MTNPQVNLTIDDAVEILRIGVSFGRVVYAARAYPMAVTEMNKLLERMKPYRAIFEEEVKSSMDELNRMLPMADGKPRFDYKIPS